MATIGCGDCVRGPLTVGSWNIASSRAWYSGSKLQQSSQNIIPSPVAPDSVRLSDHPASYLVALDLGINFQAPVSRTGQTYCICSRYIRRVV